VLVTSNLRHFDAEALAALGVKVQSPDDFLTERFAANLTRTAPSWDDYLVILEERQILRKFVARLRGWIAQPDDI